jgi:hypothetical protein
MKSSTEGQDWSQPMLPATSPIVLFLVWLGISFDKITVSAFVCSLELGGKSSVHCVWGI